MSAENILRLASKVRPAGQNKWRIPCPVHNGKDFNMIVSEDGTGKVGAHCFVCGANGMELVKALDLPPSELFPPDDGYSRPTISRAMEEKETEARFYKTIYEAEEQRRPMTLAEKRQYRLSKARLAGIEKLRNGEQGANNDSPW